MDAIRRFIRNYEGTIANDLGKPDVEAQAWRPFKFVITLPICLFEELLHQEDQQVA